MYKKDKTRIVVRDGVEGYVIQDYFEGDDRQWTVDANGNSVGMLYYRKLEPHDHILGFSAGIYDATGNPVDDDSFLHVFMLRQSASNEFLQLRAVATTPNPDGRTYDTILAATEDRSFRAGVPEDSTELREIYATNFGNGWAVGSDRRNPSFAPVAYVRWGLQDGAPAVPKHVNACLEFWRPRHCG